MLNFNKDFSLFYQLSERLVTVKIFLLLLFPKNLSYLLYYSRMFHLVMVV
jgi:hypothetical protein